MQGADPFILVDNNKYYLYFTDLKDGFKVYSSIDLHEWKDEGYCLKAGNSTYGTWGFWAPEIIKKDNKFYMVYVANEHLAVAVADSPLGPFTQKEIKPLDEEKMIDGHFFKDGDTTYLFFVRFDNGNILHAAKMSDDLLSLDLNSEVFIMRASKEYPWEKVTQYEVMEGPFVLKDNDKYFLTYSCNHTEDPNYAIGYATSDKILGPYVRYEHNPILHKNNEICGTGHHSFFHRVSDGHLMIVYHRHFSLTTNYPRHVCIGEANINDGVLSVDNVNRIEPIVK